MNFKELEKIIGVEFNNISILEQALTHRSFVNESKEIDEHNERLEFLGDAVLELVSTDFLFHKFPKEAEGRLTSYRASLVNTNTISDAATRLQFNKFLKLSKGESKDEGRARQYILADSFEAVIGAIYVDQGYEKAKEFVSRNIFPLIDEIVEKRLWQDPKSYFQERAQEVVSITPEYRLIKEEGPDHDKHFTIGVYLRNEEVAQGQGKSKQEAEQAAANSGLDAKGWR